MKRALRLLFVLALASPRCLRAGSLYPMEGGNLGHCNAALNPSPLTLPVHAEWIGQTCGVSRPPRQHPIVLSDRLIQASQRAVQAFDRSNGNLLWTWMSSMSDFYSAPCYDSSRDLIYQSDIQGHVAALRPSDGVVQWIFADGTLPAKFTLGGCTYWNDRIYVTNGMGQMVCIDANSHAAIWRTAYPGAWTGASSPAIDGGKIFVATSSTPSLVHCLDALSGAILWSKSESCSANAAITVLGTRLFIMRNDGRVDCRLASDGSLLWHYQTDSFSGSNLAVCGQLVIATSDDRCVHAIDQATGNGVWRRCFLGNFARSAALVVCGKIFVSGCAGEFYAVDGQTGNDLWHYAQVGSDNFVDWAEADGSLYVPDQSGRMYCFRSDTPGDPAACLCNLSASTQTPTPPYSATLTPSPAGSFTATPTQTPSVTLTATPSVTVTRTLSLTRTPTATPSPTSSPTLTPSRTLTPSPSSGLTQSATVSPTMSPVATAGKYDVPGGDDPSDIDTEHGACYPNPVRGRSCRFAFRMEGAGKSRIRVFAADGMQAASYSQEHPQGGLKSVECDVSAYAPGVYFFIVDRELQGGRSSKTKLEKFMVIR